MRIGDQEFTRLRVLKILRDYEPVARTELARLCGLSGTTITEIIADLLQRNLILEDKVPTGKRGRPRVNLRINADGGYVVAAYSDWHRMLQVEIVNLGGQSVYSRSTRFARTGKLDDFARDIAKILAETIAASPIDQEQIMYVGVLLPAIVDSRNGAVEYIETFPPGPSPLAAIIEETLHIPTKIEGGVNGVARAEHWFGKGPPLENLCVIVFGLGLGGAHYVNGQISSGAHGLNPELGHVKAVFDHGRQCLCGAHGCLQTYSSISAILAQLCEITGEKLPPYHKWQKTLHKHLAAALSGEEAAGQVIERAGHYLGIAIGNLINYHDPDRIVIFFYDAALMDLITPPMSEAIEKSTLHVLRGRIAVEHKALDSSYFWKGAAAMALEQLFRDR